MTKGFKDDKGKFRPTEKTSGLKSNSVIGQDEPINVPVNNETLLQQKKELGNINVRDENFGFEFIKDENRLDVSLGNFTNAGWFWDGDENDIHTFLFRMMHSKGLYDKFVDEFEQQGGTFELLQKFMKNAVNDEELYAITGDNNRWHFGEDNAEGDMANELDQLVSDGTIKEDDKDEIESLAWNNYEGVDYDDFIKVYGKNLKEKLDDAVNQSTNFGVYETAINDISEDANEDFFEASFRSVAEAVSKALDEKGIKR